MRDPTQRFSTRVGNYVRYRPSYPADIITLLAADCGLTGDSVVVDIGSGTGLLAELFLRNGNQVIGVEPNREMRMAGERLLRQYPNWRSVDGTAEETTLPGASVDLVTAGQAFHWFDRRRARAEFTRILRPAGWVVLVWNERLTTTSQFLQAYEQLLHEYATDYATVDHRNVDQTALAEFFGLGGFQVASFPNQQTFDFEGVRGRLLSSSYTPEAGDPRFEPMLHRLRAIFERNQSGGTVAFEYETRVYYGRLSD